MVGILPASLPLAVNQIRPEDSSTPTRSPTVHAPAVIRFFRTPSPEYR